MPARRRTSNANRSKKAGSKNTRGQRAKPKRAATKRPPAKRPPFKRTTGVRPERRETPSREPLQMAPPPRAGRDEEE